MRKLFTLAIAGLFSVISLSAQVLVSTQPMPKNAILEEYTGIHCTYCPDGHAIAQSIMDNNPGRAFVIAIHQGSFASPSAGEPDYRTSFGDALAGQTGLTGYPSGTVNRHVFSGSATALSRGSWASACDQIMQQTSPVNIGIATEYDAGTRVLTVDLELYYTTAPASSSNFINLAIIQDSIYGPQTGGGAGSNYRHMHMLRHLITGQWGEEVIHTGAGTFISRTYTYTIPEAYNNVPAVVENMHVVAFVAEGHQEILTGDMVPAINGTNRYIGALSSENPFVKRGYKDFEQQFDLEAVSNLEGTQGFLFDLEAENAPDDWQYSYLIDGVEYTGATSVNLEQGVSVPVAIKVTPGPSAGFPAFKLSMRSETYPGAPARFFRTMLIAGVTDLVVNGTGGPESAANQGVYLNGLQASGISSYAVTDANVMRDMINAGAHQDVFTVWLNIAWTFPALSDSQAEAVMTFMDEGHNVFIAGQDIGWDIMSGDAGSNGTEITRNFYTNYLKAIFINDGSSVNNRLNANPDDEVFGQVPQSTIIDAYGGYMYPEEIDAAPEANIIFNYNTAAKHAAIRYESPVYRSIYFGIGLEMISSTDVRNQIIGLSRQWLSDEMTGNEYTHAVSALMNGQNYPNPASDHTWIKVTEAARGGNIEIYTMNGIKAANQPVGNESIVRVDLSGLATGVYTYRVVSGSSVSEARKLTIIK